MSPADSPFAPLPAPGPHPATAELRAYAAGTLAPADEHRIEAHTLDCERCAELVEGFSMSDRATTDRAVAELRTRLQARVGQAEPEPAAGGWAWSRVAAAAALLAVIGTGIWGWEKYESATPPVAVRIKSSAPATPPADAAAPAAAPAPADAPPVAAAPAAPKATKTTANADYAAVAPSPARRAGLASPSAPHSAPPDVAMEQAGASETNAADAVAMAPPAPADDQAKMELANAGVTAPTAKSESAPPAPVAADTVGPLREVAVTMAKPMKKAKNLMAEPAAVVANTPMPAGFAIKPAPKGGTPAFRDYLRREAAQFEPEKEARISGLVHVQFTVGADGQLSNLKVTRGLRADYDEEALRLVCEGPKWQPGISGGRRAPQTLEFTIPF